MNTVTAPVKIATSDSAINTSQETTAPHKIVISLFKNEKDNMPQQRTLTWDECRGALFSKSTPRAVKGGVAFSPVSYRPMAKRGVNGVDLVYCAVFDVEHHGAFDQVRPLLDGYEYVCHSSYSHTVGHPRYRIVLPLKRPVPAIEWPTAWARLNSWASEINDPSTKDASRIYYLPSHPPGVEGHFLVHGEGRLLDVDELPLPSSQQGERAKSHPGLYVQIDGLEETPQEPRSPAIGLERVVARCKFMQTVSDPANQPQVSRPLWRAMISNASRFDDSDAWIHRASNQHPGYRAEATQKEIQSFHAFRGGPITCQRIREDGFEGCPEGGCLTVSGNVTGAPAGLWMKASGGAGRGLQGTNLIGDFEVSEEGVHKIGVTKEGKEYKVLIASRIDVLAQTVAANHSEWGYLLSVRDPNGKDNQFHLPRSMLTNKPLFQSELLKRGASIYGGADQVYSYLMACDKVADRAVTFSQPGWAVDVKGNRLFVLPGKTVHNQTEEVRAILENDDPEGRVAFAQAGGLAEWQAMVAGPASGNSRLTFTISAALTGPLLSLLNVEGGGFHLVGESSSGKTTAVEVAASVWGSPKFIQQWRATSNALESIAVRHNDTLLVLDEINQVDADDAGEIAYMLGNGRGKVRATRDALARPVSTWTMMFLSTGEQSLSEHLQSANSATMAGQEVRMVSFPADAGRDRGVFENLHSHPTPQEFADHFKTTCKTVFGTAGVAWVKAILSSDIEGLTSEIWADVGSFEVANVPDNAAPQVQRVARRFALVAAAGEAAIRRGVLPWRVGESFGGARACFQSWLDDRGGVENHEERRAISQIRRYLEQHGESRFTAWDEYSNAPGDIRTFVSVRPRPSRNRTTV